MGRGTAQIFWVPAIISGTGKATNFKFCTHIISIDRNKGPLQFSGKVAGCVVRTLKTFQSTHVLGASHGLLCDSSAVVLLLLQTGTLTSEGLDFCDLVPVINGHLDSPVHDPTQLLPCDPVIVAMATCHSLTLIGGQLSGDPLDISMFNAINWVRFLVLVSC